MCCTNLIDHLRGESDHATAQPTSSRPHAWAHWIKAQQPSQAELVEFEDEVRHLRDEQDEPHRS